MVAKWLGLGLGTALAIPVVAALALSAGVFFAAALTWACLELGYDWMARAH